MGHDVVTFSDRHGVFHDMGLWTLRHFFLTEARVVAGLEKTALAGEVTAYFESWEWVCPGVFTGPSIERIDEHSAEFVAAVLAVFAHARSRIADFGETIPLSYLQAHVNLPTAYYTGPTPIAWLIDALDRLAALLRG